MIKLDLSLKINEQWANYERQKMVLSRRSHGSAFKVKVAMEAAKETKTINEIASEHGIHSTQVAQWKKQLLEALHDIFTHGNSKKKPKKRGIFRCCSLSANWPVNSRAELVKKNLVFTIEELKMMIEPGLQNISISRQCDLVGLPHSSYYYPPATESSENLLFDAIDRRRIYKASILWKS